MYVYVSVCICVREHPISRETNLILQWHQWLVLVCGPVLRHVSLGVRSRGWTVVRRNVTKSFLLLLLNCRRSLLQTFKWRCRSFIDGKKGFYVLKQLFDRVVTELVNLCRGKLNDKAQEFYYQSRSSPLRWGEEKKGEGNESRGSFRPLDLSLMLNTSPLDSNILSILGVGG